MTPLKPEPTVKMLNKVPEITLFFWVIKVLATTVGETAVDFLSVTLNLGLSVTSCIMGGLLVVALLFQFKFKQYVPWAYWVSIILISIVGTLITDLMVDKLGVSLEQTTTLFGLALAVTFTVWYGAEKTLSIHTIYTSKRELFYWVAIVFTFALGTAAGDLAAEGLDLGYAQAALIFGALIALVSYSYFFLKLNAIPTFWIAYILTRPLGASFGDLLSQPFSEGGLSLGTVTTSMAFLAAITGLVTVMTIVQKKQTPQITSTRQDS